jgi:hypothetical protein
MIVLRSALLLAAALALPPRLARADDPDPPYPSSPPCVDSSDVVGYRQCPAFGEWGQAASDPYVFVQLGMNYRHFVHPGATAVSRRAGPAPAEAQTDDAMTVDERLGFGITHHLYAALDIEFGNFGEFDSSSPTSRDVVLDGMGSIGLRGSLGPLSLAVEAAGGGLAYTYPTDADYHTEAILEARGRADVWLAPWFTVGAMAGSSLLRKGEWVTGIYVGFHTHAYADDR